MCAGVPRDEEGWERLAAALYRGVLRALPASAMAWFGALRDRGLAADLEVPLHPRPACALTRAPVVGTGEIAFCRQCFRRCSQSTANCILLTFCVVAQQQRA